MVDLTLDYYNTNAHDFYQNTVDADLEVLYKPFLALVSPKGTILDAGCGSGRDSLYFMQKGYRVTSFDASSAMAELCTQLTGQQCLLLDFSQLDFEDEFDGIWACASLLHVSRDRINGILERLTRALRTRGIIYASFKYGDGEETRNGRFFNNYNEESFNRVLAKHPNLELLDYKITGDVRPDKKEERWLNVLSRKKY